MNWTDNLTSEQWAKLNHRLMAFARKRMPNSDDAVDVVQDTLLKAFENASSLRNLNKLDKWLFQILRNLINDYYRTTPHSSAVPVALELEQNQLNKCEHDDRQARRPRALCCGGSSRLPPR